jgi:hypothetical protein
MARKWVVGSDKHAQLSRAGVGMGALRWRELVLDLGSGAGVSGEWIGAWVNRHGDPLWPLPSRHTSRVPARGLLSKGNYGPRRVVHNAPRRRSNTSGARLGRTYHPAMLRSGGSASPTGGSGEHAGGRTSSPGAGPDLQSALDRLSLSLERIENLLGELHSTRQPHCGTGAEQATRRADREEPGDTHVARTGDAHVIHGGGPSAFTRR